MYKYRVVTFKFIRSFQFILIYLYDKTSITDDQMKNKLFIYLNILEFYSITISFRNSKCRKNSVMYIILRGAPPTQNCKYIIYNALECWWKID